MLLIFGATSFKEHLSVAARARWKSATVLTSFQFLNIVAKGSILDVTGFLDWPLIICSV